jgi:hypothetical protein
MVGVTFVELSAASPLSLEGQTGSSTIGQTRIAIPIDNRDG